MNVLISHPSGAAQRQGMTERNGWQFEDIVRILRRRVNIIILVLAASLAPAVIYLLAAPPKYTAIAWMVPDLKRNPSAPNEVARDGLTDPSIVETQIEMLKSEAIALSVIDKLSLSQDPELVGDGPGALARALGISSPRATLSPDDKRRVAAASFSRMLKVTRAGHSYLAEIAFTSIDPVKAALVANAVVDAYVQEQLAAKFTNAERSSTWMQQRLAELAQKSANAKKAIDDYKAANHLELDTSGGPTIERGENRPAEATPEQVDKLKQLEGTYQTSLQLHDSLQNRFARVNEFVQQQSLPFTEARVVSQATPPLKPSSPKVALTLLLALLAGCTIGVAAALGLEYFDRTVRRPEQIEDGLGLRALGSVHRFRPRLSRQARLRAIGLWRDKSKRRGVYLAQKINDWLSDGAGEALRYVEVALNDNVPSTGAHVLAVISPNRGEGKTVVALGLAMLAARCGKRTLLVDADVRKRSLTRALQSDLPGDQPTALTYRSSHVDGITREDPGFSFLGLTGVQQSHSPELVASNSLRNTLEQIRDQYDYVIVDTPALKSHVDVFAAARFFDTFIMLAEWKRTKLDDISGSLVRSAAISDRLLGVLINKCPHKDRGLGALSG